MSTCVRNTAIAGKQLGNRETRERLHHCLHQIAKLIEQNQLDTLVDVLAESLEPTDLKRFAFTLNNRLRGS